MGLVTINLNSSSPTGYSAAGAVGFGETTGANSYVVIGNTAGSALYVSGNTSTSAASPSTLVVYGQAGNDSIYVGNGGSGVLESAFQGYITIDGGAGNDAIYANGAAGGVASIQGGAGNDSIYAYFGLTANSYTIDGGAGVDSIFGGFGNDTIIYDSADTRVDGGAGTNTLSAAGAGAGVTIDFSLAATQAIYSNFGAIVGSGYGDRIVANGTPFGTTIDGGAGADSLYSTVDGVTIKNFDSADAIINVVGTTNVITMKETSTALDLSNAFSGVTRFTGTGTFGTVTGSSANDVIVGDRGVNAISGGDGNDMIWGYYNAGGGDTYTGGNGADTFFVTTNASGNFNGTTTITDAGSTDVVNFYNIAASSLRVDNNILNDLGDTAVGPDLKIKDAAGNTIVSLTGAVGAGNSTSKFVTADGYTFGIQYGKDTDDAVTGSSLTDILFGGWGNDTLDGGSGVDALFGGQGDDVFKFSNNDTTYNGGAGVNTLTAASAGAGVFINETNGNFQSIQNVVGSSYADAIFGSTASEVINGGAGNDILWGNVGTDTLIGGAGADTYYFSSADGVDTIAAGTQGAADANSMDTVKLYKKNADGTYTSDNLTTSDVALSYSGTTKDLTLTVAGSANLIVQGWGNNDNNKLNTFVFGGKTYQTDGTTWTLKA